MAAHSVAPSHEGAWIEIVWIKGADFELARRSLTRGSVD